MTTVNVSVKRSFFDRAAVINEIGKWNAAALGKAGAYVQRRARSSMRRRKKPSAVGSPPSAHSTDAVASLKNIWFAYDRENQSVVVGPLRLNQVQQSWITGANTTVPGIHEFGDVVTVREVSSNKGKTWRRRDMRRNPRTWETFRQRRAVYKPRPFMAPALAKEMPNFPSLWAGGTARAA